MPSSWTRQFALAYAWHGRLYGDIAEFNASADYSRKAYELRERRSEPVKYFITAHLHIAEACPRAEMPHNFLSGLSYPVLGRYEESGEEGKKQLGFLRTTPSAR